MPLARNLDGGDSYEQTRTPKGESIPGKNYSDNRDFRLHVCVGWMRGNIQRRRYAEGMGKPPGILVKAPGAAFPKDSSAGRVE